MASKKDRLHAARQPKMPPPSQPDPPDPPSEVLEAFVQNKAPPLKQPSSPASRPSRKLKDQPSGPPVSQPTGDLPNSGRGVVIRGGIAKRRLTAYLDQELGQAAVLEAARRGIEISELVAEALRGLLAFPKAG